MKQQKILVVEDDGDIQELISLCLRQQGFLVEVADSGEKAIQMHEAINPDLILLDVVLPKVNGIEVCQLIRKNSIVPIIFLTSKWEAKDVITGFDVGGDDYITKPFNPDVLLARVKSNLRRVNFYEQDDTLAFGKLKINRKSYEVSFHGEEIPLLAKEIKLLLFLAERSKQVFSAEQLYDYIWDAGEGDSRTVMVHISNLRKKLKRHAPNTVKIETIKGVGYRLVPENEQ